jgi:hypothetical protein
VTASPLLDELEGLVKGLAAGYASATTWTEFVENLHGQ